MGSLGVRPRGMVAWFAPPGRGHVVEDVPMKRALFALICGLLLGAGPGEADPPQPDQAFLDEQIPQVETMARELLAAPHSPRGSMEGVKALLIQRQSAINQLGQRIRLSSFDGIRTQDLYDESVVRALHEVVLAGIAADTTAPPDEDVFLYAEAMSGLPPLGQSPVPFMIVGMAQSAVTVADTLVSRGLLPRASADKLSLRAVHHATEAYEAMQGDLLTADKVAGFHESAVLIRLRCPEDDGQYQVNHVKTRGSQDGAISRVYYLQCTVCAKPLAVEFPQELASELNRRTKRQKMKEKPKPTRPDAGLDP